MAERKQGPVKPPTIDLTAREAGAGGEKPARRTARKAAAEPVEAVGPVDIVEPVDVAESAATVSPEDVVTAADADALPPPQPIPPRPPVPPEPPRVAPRAAVAGGAPPPWSMLATAAGVGALLGTALTYILATMVPLPAPPVQNLAPALSAQADRLTTIEDRLAAAETGTMDVRTSVDDTSANISARLAALEGGLEQLRASVPAPVDTSAIEARLRTLTSRVDAIAAGASSADAGAMADNIGDLEAALAALTTEVNAIKTGAADNGALTALAADVAALKAEAEAAAAEPEPVPQTALAVTIPALESAFATGRPFATELAGLATAEPPVAIDAALSDRAGTGLVRPDVLDQQFAAAVPAMLEVKPAVASGDWQQTAGDWIASLLAIRPAGEVAGDSPEAVVSRLEGAMSRHDYAAATALFAALPPEMVAAAGTVRADIAAHAAAAQLVADLRAKASAP